MALRGAIPAMTCHIAAPRYAPTEKHTAEKRARIVCGELIARATRRPF
jgi:hypothetical protein